MNWTKIAEFPMATPLHELHAYLDSHKVVHRITEQTDKQVLWLLDTSQIHLVKQYFDNLERGEKPTFGTLDATSNKSSEARKNLGFIGMAKCYGLTLSFIFLGLCGFFIVALQFSPALLRQLIFMPFIPALQSGEIWRLISPTFLHFSLLHVLFNCLWMWELGRRIELFAGKRSYLILFIFSALAANYCQYYLALNGIFGGLSGVVYALLGYLFIWGRFHSSPLVKMPPGIYIFMLAWLALGIFGVIDQFIDGRVANGAHFGGLVAGIIVASIEVWTHKKSHTSKNSN